MDMFGNNKNQSIRQIVKSLVESTDSVCNENALGNVTKESEINTMADFIKKSVMSSFEGVLDESIIAQDALNVAQMYKNNIKEQLDQKLINESAAGVNIVTLTTSIATTIRAPYEASLHRVFDTMVVDKPVYEIEEVIPTVTTPDGTTMSIVDAFAPGNDFVAKTEISLTDLKTTGLVPPQKNIDLLDSLDPLYKLSKDMRIDHIDVTLDVEGTPTPIAAANIKLKKGCSPYFDAKSSTLSALYEVTNGGTTVDVDVTCKVDFATGTLEYLRADAAVKKVYFVANISHEEHTHPIVTGFKNGFVQYPIPTRPHIEVSAPQEVKTDAANSNSYMANVDIITAMTENISVLSSRIEDQRLKGILAEDGMFNAEFDFEAPTQFAHGNIEWFKREFIPFLDQIAVSLKNEYNVEDCHFRIAVSPFIIRLLDAEYNTDKGQTEDAKGSGVINYSIAVKTSTSVFYFISSQAIDADKIKVVLIPNNFKKSEVKTYAYMKYSSFLTDNIRKSSNPKLAAIVYSERNQPLAITKLACDVKVTHLAVKKTSGTFIAKR